MAANDTMAQVPSASHDRDDSDQEEDYEAFTLPEDVKMADFHVAMFSNRWWRSDKPFKDEQPKTGGKKYESSEDNPRLLTILHNLVSHAEFMRGIYLARIDRRRIAAGKPPLTEAEREPVNNAVELINRYAEQTDTKLPLDVMQRTWEILCDAIVRMRVCDVGTVKDGPAPITIDSRLYVQLWRSCDDLRSYWACVCEPRLAQQIQEAVLNHADSSMGAALTAIMLMLKTRSPATVDKAYPLPQYSHLSPAQRERISLIYYTQIIDPFERYFAQQPVTIREIELPPEVHVVMVLPPHKHDNVDPLLHPYFAIYRAMLHACPRVHEHVFELHDSENVSATLHHKLSHIDRQMVRQLKKTCVQLRKKHRKKSVEIVLVGFDSTALTCCRVARMTPIEAIVHVAPPLSTLEGTRLMADGDYAKADYSADDYAETHADSVDNRGLSVWTDTPNRHTAQLFVTGTLMNDDLLRLRSHRHKIVKGISGLVEVTGADRNLLLDEEKLFRLGITPYAVAQAVTTTVCQFIRYCHERQYRVYDSYVIPHQPVPDLIVEDVPARGVPRPSTKAPLTPARGRPRTSRSRTDSVKSSDSFTMPPPPVPIATSKPSLSPFALSAPSPATNQPMFAYGTPTSTNSPRILVQASVGDKPKRQYTKRHKSNSAIISESAEAGSRTLPLEKVREYMDATRQHADKMKKARKRPGAEHLLQPVVHQPTAISMKRAREAPGQTQTSLPYVVHPTTVALRPPTAPATASSVPQPSTSTTVQAPITTATVQRQATPTSVASPQVQLQAALRSVRPSQRTVSPQSSLQYSSTTSARLVGVRQPLRVTGPIPPRGTPTIMRPPSRLQYAGRLVNTSEGRRQYAQLPPRTVAIVTSSSAGRQTTYRVPAGVMHQPPHPGAVRYIAGTMRPTTPTNAQPIARITVRRAPPTLSAHMQQQPVTTSASAETTTMSSKETTTSNARNTS